MKRDAFKLPLYWGELFKQLDDREVGIIIRNVFAWIDSDLVEQAKLWRKNLFLSEEATEIFDICLEDIRYQQQHHHSYRVPEESRGIRNSTAYSEWRKAVYERDRYTCQRCGKCGGKLNAHHIKPFALYPDLRLNLDNGITLCEDCHKIEHGKRVRVNA